MGKPDTRQDISAHTPGVRQGNEPGGIDEDPGLYPAGEHGAGRPGAKATATLRGDPQAKFELNYKRVEPYVVPKKSLTGDITERVDTRVL